MNKFLRQNMEIEICELPLRITSNFKNSAHGTKMTIYVGWNFNSGNYLFTTDTK